jgi:hypothetical protein
MTPVDAQSKRIEQLEPELLKRWLLFKRDFQFEHPAEPQPYVVSTYRDAHEQQAKVDAGLSDATPGHSLHNFTPCAAIDYGFKRTGESDLLYDADLFRKAFPLLIRLGLQCGVWIRGTTGGLWHDKGHTCAEGYTWQRAAARMAPNWTIIPEGDR